MKFTFHLLHRATLRQWRQKMALYNLTGRRRRPNIDAVPQLAEKLCVNVLLLQF